MGNGNGTNGTNGKVRGVALRLEDNGTISIQYGPLVKWIAAVLLTFVVSEIGRTIVQGIDHARLLETREDLAAHKSENTADHARMVKIEELGWRIANYLYERERLNSGSTDDQKKGSLNAKPSRHGE